MTSTSIACGLLLILIGLIGYINGWMTGHASITALIPAFFGIVLAALGFIARAKEGSRKLMMHIAVVIALIGFIVPFARLAPKLGELTFTAAVISQVAMSLVCLVFVILGIKSFADARRKAV